MEKSWKDKSAHWFIGIILVATIVSGCFFLFPIYQRRQQLQRQDEELAQRIESKRKEIASLVECQRRFRTDPDFVEHIARQSRRVFPGELVFVFKEK
jgi:cell division protein FtsB